MDTRLIYRLQYIAINHLPDIKHSCAYMHDTLTSP
ncbi:hypothetical protein T05_2754 [Trichinella murrelli]|uniref:Uncharacterized protein n=1 Tax=Trichinella murrelli TaxID=144512 RepID=A0A0V0SW06_9BILA|nr:hypothetical protein T05_2754 [Trichinella murrelli]